jgi:hypothetical protein
LPQRNKFPVLAQKPPFEWQVSAGIAGWREDIPPMPETAEAKGDGFGVWCRHRTRVAANEGVPEMPVVLPSRSTPIRTYSAIALFLVVYVGVLFVIFAPRDMIAVESGVAFYGAED